MVRIVRGDNSDALRTTVFPAAIGKMKDLVARIHGAFLDFLLALWGQALKVYEVG